MDYWTSDRPDGTPGYQFHDLGDDFEELYAHPEYFFFAGMALGAHTIADQLRAARGVPAFQVTVYRAVPLGVTVVNTGDWVTPAREYAVEFAAAGATIICATVPAASLSLGADSMYEWGYFGPPVTAATA